MLPSTFFVLIPLYMDNGKTIALRAQKTLFCALAILDTAITFVISKLIPQVCPSHLHQLYLSASTSRRRSQSRFTPSHQGCEQRSLVRMLWYLSVNVSQVATSVGEEITALSIFLRRVELPSSASTSISTCGLFLLSPSNNVQALQTA